MSFKFGGGKSKSSTTAKEDFTKTSTPNVPDWILGPAQGAMSKIQELAAYDPSSLVPGANPLQQEGGSRAYELGDYAAIDKLLNTPAPTTQAESLLTNLEKYLSGQEENVVNAALADFDFGAGQTRAQQALDLAGSGAFGGSGAAITQSMTEDALNRGRASTSANLRDQAYTRATGLSNQDAARRQAANDLNAQLAAQTRAQKAQMVLDRESGKRADLSALFGAGETFRGIATEQAQAPFQLADWSIDALGGLNLGNFIGQTDTGSSTSSGTSKGKNSSWGMDINMSDIAKLMAGMG